MNGVSLLLLAIFSGFSVNLVFQLGLGVKDASGKNELDRKSLLIKPGIVFVSVLILWPVFAKVFASFLSGFTVYLLVFPAGSLVYYIFEHLAYRFVLKEKSPDNYVFCDGFTAAALFISLAIARTFGEALALSLGFAAGIMLSFLVLGEIRRRSLLEAVPVYLRGRPLMIISMGLLSLIFSSTAYALYAVLGAK